MMRIRAGQYRFNKVFEGTGGWASTLPFEGWTKPFRFMGPIELTKPRKPPPPPVVLDCVISYETQRAWLVMIDGREHWLPKSHCELSDDDRRIEIPDWLWRQRRQEREVEAA